MVFGVKGPKSILSSAIANALAEYFVVDAKQIESNLLTDTKIVLNNVLLRKQVARLPMNSAGTPTLITVTGSVKQVTFSWTWAVGSNKDENNLDAWVKDSKLTMEGLNFKAALDYGTGKEELTAPHKTPEESSVVDKNQATAIQKQGGFQAFITKQVQMIIDSLDLDVEDFEFTVTMPPPLTKPNDAKDSKEEVSLVMSGNKVQNISHGRQPDDGATPSETSSVPPTVIQQQVSFGSLSLSVIISVPSQTGNDNTLSTTTYPIIEPFGYSAELTRSSGQRFSGFGTGLTFIGKPAASSSDDNVDAPSDNDTNNDLVMHFGQNQVEALTQLGVMLLAPPDEAGTTERQGEMPQNKAVNGDLGSQSKSNDTKKKVKTEDGPQTETESETVDGGSESQPKPNGNSTSAVESGGEVQNEQGTLGDGNQEYESQDSSTPLTAQNEHQQQDEPGPATSSTEKQEETSKSGSSSSTTVQKESSSTDSTSSTQTEDELQATTDNITDQDQEAKSLQNGTHSSSTPDQNADAVSAFVLPMKSVSLILDGNAKMTFPLLVLSYEADGTVMDVTASGCRLETMPSEDENEATTMILSGVKASFRPNIDLVINEVTKIYIPNVIQLTKPIENPRISFEGSTVSIDIDSIEGKVPNVQNVEPQSRQPEAPKATVDAASTTESVSGSSTPKTSTTDKNASAEESASDEESKSQDDSEEDQLPRIIVPFPLILSVDDIKVQKMLHARELDLYLNPNQATNSTDVALRLNEFDSELLQCDQVDAFAALPLDQPNEIKSFTLAVKSARVSAGHSTDEWEHAFKPQQQQQPSTNHKGSKTKSKPTVLKFPFASISPLKLKIAWQGKGVAIKDTEVSFKPFKGDSNTTSKDLESYYVGACLSRVPGFISNADVLGLNVVDSAAATYGTFLGKDIFGNFLGAGGGLAALVAVDGVKGATRAGKESRDKDNGSSYQLGDVIRGVIYSAGQATKTGAFKRGRQDAKGNVAEEVADFLVGISTETGDYVTDNRTKLGAAAGGGVGTIVGTVMAGPIGGVIGGLLTTALTGKAIESAEEHANKTATLKLEADPTRQQDEPAAS